jgi:site-specific recombinase XerD
MSRRTKKRVRIVAKKSTGNKITISEKTKRDGDYEWKTYFVQGWKEGGKWQRKQFKDRRKAEVFAADKRVEMANEGTATRLLATTLTEDQLDAAKSAFKALGDTYGIDEAVTFFLRHHRAPDFTIEASEAMERYLLERERDGVRARTLTQMRSTIQSLVSHAHDPQVHEVSAQTIEAFLRSLRAKDGANKASLKTWNNYRNDLHKFFDWCAESDKSTERPWTFDNPVSKVRKYSAKQVREEQDATPATTSAKKVQRMLSVLMRWRSGRMVRYFAFLYFSGVRPDELKRLAEREGELVNLKTGVITIPADISKTRHARQVTIKANLRKWLDAAPGSIIPKNFDRLAKQVRAHFKLSHDEARHSYISYHVALHRSIGEASLQAGNSETIVRRHYLNLHPAEEGEAFFSIVPDITRRRAVVDSKSAPKSQTLLKAV